MPDYAIWTFLPNISETGKITGEIYIEGTIDRLEFQLTY